MKTPVLQALQNLKKENSISFHMPGHKGKNTLINWSDYIPYIDTTEIEGMDNLLEPRGIIQESQENAAKVFGAKATYYGVNGSTGSNYIALATITKPGDKILVQRNCHKSIYNGMVINRLTPVYLYPEYNENYNILTGIHPEDVDKILREDPEIKAVVLTYPNYYGVCSDLKKIADIVHKHDKILMVDEAHGPHMTFSEGLPMSALEAGADIVTHSTHKTLPSFTQTSLLHVGTDRIDLNKLRDRYQLFTTTSPSYLFTLSNEISVAYMDSQEGKEKIEWNIDKSKEIVERLNSLDRVEAFLEDPSDETIFDKDVTKILIRIDGMKGSEVERKLWTDYNIRLEMSDYYYALAYSSLLNTDEEFEELFNAIEDMAKNQPYEEINRVSVKMPDPKIVMSPAEAYYSRKNIVQLKDAVGKVAASPVIPYPPGVPLIHAGEEFTQEIYSHILFLMENGLEIVGLMGKDKDSITIVE